MSYRDPAVTAGTVPPARPRRRISPGMLIGVGVTALIATVLIGIVAFAVITVQAVRQPLDVPALEKEMADLPLFPLAKLDEIMTKANRGVPLTLTLRENPAQKATVAAYRIAAMPERIVEWYDRELKGAGYTVVATAELADAPTSPYQRRYRRDDELIIVQSQQPSDEEEAVAVIFRLKGYRGQE